MSKTNKANEELLNGLHQLVAKDLMRRIASGEATPGELAAAIRFLKDNDVTADIEFSASIRQLEQEVVSVGELPFIDEEDEDE